MVDGLRLDKKSLLEALHTEYDQLQAILAMLTPAAMHEPNVVGWWSVKEVVAHMIYWNQFPVNEIRAALEGHPFDHPDLSDEDTINAAAIVPYQDRTMDEVQGAFTQSFEAVVNLIEILPERAFDPGGEVERLLGDTIADAINSNTFDHYALHRKQIESWIATRA